VVVVRQRPLARSGHGRRRGWLGYSGPVDLAVALTTFVVIFPAELPDKSLFASLVLGTRFRPLPVFCGVAAAFAVHVLIAVTVGGVFALLPQRLVLFVMAALFAGGSAWLLLGRGTPMRPRRRPDPPGPPSDRRRPGRAGGRHPGRGGRLLTGRLRGPSRRGTLTPVLSASC
jgi:Uncharacterized protein family UPF0016